MIDSFAFSEVVRKLANIIRIGKIAEIKDNLVKVQIGRVTTGWLPIVSTAGKTSVWTPISKDEQVADAIDKWEPRFKVEKITINSIKEGHINLSLIGRYLITQQKISLEDLVI